MTIREGNQMNATIARTVTFGAASLLAAVLLAGTALADGLPGRGRPVATPDAYDTRPCSVSGYVGATTDNVFRGFSKSNEDPSGQGTVDLTCGRFYAGVSGAGVDLGGSGTEFDAYGGYRFSTGLVNWDLGLIYYAFSGADDLNFVELKGGASGAVWQGGTLGGTVSYAPDYFGNLGNTWTVEGSFAQTLPKVDRFSPTFSAALGHSFIDRDDQSYTYWNAGLTVGFLEKWSVDFRYWDTNDRGLCEDESVCDSRFVASVKYKF
jgi:uncharacterized protein (TIGR02001 family)